METTNRTVITVQATVNAPVQKVWDYWNQPQHITQWCSASPDWHTPRAENDLREGGSFSSRMEAKDGSFGFDFGGIYDVVKNNEYIEYTIGDGRKVKIHFTPSGDTTKIVESFEAEETNPVEMQQGGWQAILDNFKKYTESN
ncbi:SRPBCC family protein [Ferruginibacter sp.]